MNETGDLANHLLTVALIAFYWTLLGNWAQLLPGAGVKAGQADESSAQREDVAEDTSSLVAALDSIREIDPNFDMASFMSGAKKAYAAVLQAYAEGNIGVLRGLVGADVLDSFGGAILGRETRRENLQLALVRLSEATVMDAFNQGNGIEIVVRFVADVISVTRSADDRVIDGDPIQIIEVRDVWTFEHDARSKDPVWRLIATDNA
ncbi:Tim44/TimA family putative adaptor protein [Mesorhizobium sp. ESP7-2]|uniref:Tim44/TimA family putative adaptor protein n=1 Tax=Mesorhizobium sp. ESP7-2 TaxID=2876622 RepID=UPI001CCCB1F6|nr:Tim44/TimA family putative adaptor protein [Mesorhizobium sp. ESP7-2]MBZ9708573.1 Tim44/TimA family putative adaptor protein [Mesorhizobium sp. ESP7-2]